MQVFKGKYVCTAYYQLPLIRGPPMIGDLQQLATQPLQTWLRSGAKSGEVSRQLVLYVDDKDSQIHCCLLH